jgi:hypothetical protein
MDSIIKDCNNYHISLLKVILILIGKDIDLNKDYKILELNNIFKDISADDLIVNISNHNTININEFDDEDEDEDEDIDDNDDTIKPVKNNYDEEEDEEEDDNVDTIKSVKNNKNNYDDEEEDEI